MTNSKSTKRALLTRALAMLMCVAMLIGTTFAWFTDTASTAVNKIQSGTLDVELWKSDADEKLSEDALKWVKAEGHETDEVLWEPGCTYNLESFRIKNNGNLALKYKVIISGIIGDAELLEAIDFTVSVDGTDLVPKDGTSTVTTVADLNNFEGTLAAGAVTGKITITGHMKEDAGNEYQNLSIDGISITVVATQDTVEYDSNGNTYDALAQYPVYTVADVTTKTDDGKTVVASEVTIASEETTTVGTETVSVATATIPENVVLDAETTQVKLVVEDSKDANNISITSDQAKKTLEVKLEGVSRDNTVPATVSFYIEKGLTGLVLYHNGETMTKVASADAVTSDQDYYYDFATGKITMKSATFSPFTYVYDATVATTAELAAVTDDTAKTVTISSAKLLAGFAQSVNNGKSYAGYTITLTKDIDLAGREWTPIGEKAGTKFDGTFDGGNHTVSGLKVTSKTVGVDSDNSDGNATRNEFDGFGALFGAIEGGTVKNLTVSGTVNCDNAGGIVSRMNGGTIENCTSNVNVTGARKAGGIVCAANSATCTINNCTNNGKVDLDATAASKFKGNKPVGGIVGYSNTCTVENCINNGTIGSANVAFSGGVVGYATNNPALVTNSTNKGNVTGTANAAGIIGIVLNKNSATVKGCTNTGTIDAGSGTKGDLCTLNGNATVTTE